MNTVSTLHDIDEPKAGESTLFDALARLVPEELHTAYYRVLAHTRTLSPDDEMLRILEAMGILTLLTWHTPKDIADERERIQEMLNLHLQFSSESQQKMLAYVRVLESRLAELPCEIKAGLDPPQIAKTLGESLRQNFVQSGVADTVAGLQATAAAMGNVQKQFVVALRDLCDPQYGITAKVESANRNISNSLERRTKGLDCLLHEFKIDLLRIWMPLAAGASLFIGLFVGMEIQGRRDSGVPTSASVQSSEQQVSVDASKVETDKKPAGASIVAPHGQPRLSQK